MASDQFDEPDETIGIRLNPRDIIGHLVMVWATDYIPHSPTRHTKPGKPSDVIVVDVVDLDQVDELGQPGLLARQVWWRQVKLIMALKGRIGKPTPILAKMGQGKATQGLPPFELFSMTSDAGCVQRANAWLTAHPDFTPSARGEQNGEQPHWGDQEEQPAWSKANPNPQPEVYSPPAVAPQETMLERMARQAAQGASRLPTRPDQQTAPF